MTPTGAPGDDEDGWTVATGKKTRSSRSKRIHTLPEADSRCRKPVSETAISKALAGVATSLETLRGHPYASNVLSKLPNHVSKARIYWVWGLGSLDNLAQAQLVRYQAALALLLEERLPELAGPPEAVDPVFTSLDVAVYERLGFLTQTGNHDWTVDAPTLLFAPHLEQVFATRLLRTTHTKGLLKHLIYIGNSISKCLERNHVRMAHTPEDIAFLEAVGATMTEVPLPELGFATICPGAFNDLALHSFS